MIQIHNPSNTAGGYPTREEAERLLKEAEALNPGPWGNHSRTAAHCAEAIAAKCPGMDREKAYILGLLHDDALAGADGVLDIEERMSDVKRRYGFYPQNKWDGNLYLKHYFEEKAGGIDIYTLVEKDAFRPAGGSGND